MHLKAVIAKEIGSNLPGDDHATSAIKVAASWQVHNLNLHTNSQTILCKPDVVWLNLHALALAACQTIKLNFNPTSYVVPGNNRGPSTVEIGATFQTNNLDTCANFQPITCTLHFFDGNCIWRFHFDLLIGIKGDLDTVCILVISSDPPTLAIEVKTALQVLYFHLCADGGWVAHASALYRYKTERAGIRAAMIWLQPADTHLEPQRSP
mmetsp:Transcript_115338/g.222359  ORF Transcript_115338/g.222359 Transcript_115338/m.222359 type:complete len:209 (-) Transcript_115338:7-633(-)